LALEERERERERERVHELESWRETQTNLVSFECMCSIHAGISPSVEENFSTILSSKCITERIHWLRLMESSSSLSSPSRSSVNSLLLVPSSDEIRETLEEEEEEEEEEAAAIGISKDVAFSV
jgi:hypothetical protein